MKNNNKKFEIRYWKLSCKGKIIRILWTIPLFSIFLLLLWFEDSDIIRKAIITFGIILILLIELISNYYKLKNPE